MAKRRNDRRLPATAYAVLGLVSFGETSGYDLKQFADSSIRYFFWSPAKSQIYSELRRLHSLGYVTEREVEQERRPDKRLYHITTEGEGALREWIEDPRGEQDIRKSTFLLKVFFGRHMSVETLIGRFEELRRQAQDTLAQYKAIERGIHDKREYLFPYLTLKSGLAHVKAHIAWIEGALEQIREQRQSFGGDRPEHSSDTA